MLIQSNTKMPLELLCSIFEFFNHTSRLRLELICALFAVDCQKWCNIKYLNFSKETCNWLDMESGNVELKMIKAFNVIILRCAVYLKSLRLCYGVPRSSFVGRHFRSLTSLTHFSMEEPIDVWHLNRIEEFLAPNLLSLGLVLQPQEESVDAFLFLVKNCKKLKCLRVNRINRIFERFKEIGQQQFLPPTLIQLFMHDYSDSALNQVIETCPRLCFVLLNKPDGTKMHSFYSPFFITTDRESIYSHPSLKSLRALQIKRIKLNKALIYIFLFKIFLD
uniref:Uncharacterized protein n=1 Tax=Meloidogyne enterolobii TaxID=390850 RepID=A0A6V7WXV9_MELEN|nr:unnamed protein product [Meloidogyne enterolobii]